LVIDLVVRSLTENSGTDGLGIVCALAGITVNTVDIAKIKPKIIERFLPI
jgi:hypothetical protein